MLKSWYAFFFQLPGLPERMVSAGHWKLLIKALPAHLSEGALARYREAWGQPGAITGMINWYRATFRKTSSTTRAIKIQVPTLLLWGNQDPHLSYEMAPLSFDLCEKGQLVSFEDATHWVLQNKSGAMSQHLIRHFSEKN